MDVNPTAVLLLQYMIFLLQPLKPAPVGLPAPASRGRLCCRTGCTAPPYFIAGHAIHLLTHTSCYFPATAAGPVNPRTPHRGQPLPSLPRLRVVPFLGLAVIHRHGALGAAWLTWSRNDFHRTWTVRREADSWVHGCSKCLLITRKIIIPPPDSRDPPDGPPVFREKNVFP